MDKEIIKKEIFWRSVDVLPKESGDILVSGVIIRNGELVKVVKTIYYFYGEGFEKSYKDMKIEYWTKIPEPI